MPTQEEVLEAIHKLGCATYRELKQYFGLENLKGSSNLPQRLKALERDGLIAVFRFGRRSLIVPTELKYTKEEIEEFLREIGAKLKTRGRPEGLVEIREECLLKVLKFIRENKIVTARQVQEAMGWNWRTTMKYLNRLLEDGLIFEIQNGKHRLYTISLI